MSGPLCGSLYEARIPGSVVVQLLVLTENAWNERMGDSVTVPVYEVESARPNDFHVEIAPGLMADCTRAQNMPHDFFGPWVGVCHTDPWVRSRIGVRKHLDIDRRIAGASGPTPASARTAWWPRQRNVHFAGHPAIPRDKLFAALSADAWNSRPAARYCSAVRLTSRTKPQRLRWEVPVRDGWVVSGDLYVVAYAHMDQSDPDPHRYPTRITADESAALAVRQRATLELR